MTRNKFTVTVAVCALNEEDNIKNFLDSIVAQKQDKYTIKKILVISDGSTDRTVEEIKKVKSKVLVLKDYKDRKGKSFRLNEIYTSIKTDFLVLSDADVIFKVPDTIKHLIQPLIDDTRKEVGLVGGEPFPLKPTTFIERSIKYTLDVYIPIRNQLRGGDNVLSATGRIMALRRELANKIVTPAETISNDGFAYFSCLTKGYKYKHASKAIAYFRSPTDLNDQIKQNTRFMATQERLAMYFPKELIDREYYIPKGILLKNMLVEFIKHPIESLFIFIINRYCELNAWILKTRINAIWDLVYTTKKLKNNK